MITHKSSTTVVFQTTDYSQFAFLKGNRSINQKKVERIIKEIKAGNDAVGGLITIKGKAENHFNIPLPKRHPPFYLE